MRRIGTTHVAVHTTIVSNQVVHLIDTPGFDDSGRSDGETLQELAYWLAAAYEREIRLSGIVYLHRITDIRLQGSAWRALRALKSICGDNNLHDVVIATTMWDKIAPDHVAGAFARHGELRKKINKEMGCHGGSIVALPSIKNDAIAIVEQIVRKGSRMTLAFQKQLVDEHKPIRETEAGKILFEAFNERTPHLEMAIDTTHNEMLERIATARADNARYSRAVTTSMLARMDPARDEMRRFEQKLPEIRREWEERLQKDREGLEMELVHSRNLLESRNKTLADIRRSGTRPSNSEVLFRDETSLAPVRKDPSRRVEEVARWRQSRKVENRYPTHGTAASAGFGAVGTALAVGQLVAAVACNVM
jgi:hypothetical protein